MEKTGHIDNNNDMANIDNDMTDDNIDNHDTNDGQHQTDKNDNNGDDTRDKNSIKSNDDVSKPNSQASFQSKTGVVEKSTLTSPSTSLYHSSWKSTNPFVNYMRDCRKHEFPGQLDRKNFFQFAGTQWRSMSSKQKQPYIIGAAMIKRQKLLEMKISKMGQKRKRLKGEMTMRRAHSTSKKNNNKKLIKPKRREKKKVKKQRLFKHDSGSDTASDDTNESSDNESNASDEIV